jgi:ABC-type bacteriocin/lantibiotic exporter with double-glycine peptidase domain
MINDIKAILDKKSLLYLVFIFFGLIISALLEMIGIGLLPSLVLAINNTDLFLSKVNYLPVKNHIMQMSKEKLLIYFCTILFVIFLFKNIFLYFLIIFENHIMKNIRISLSKKLMEKYLLQQYLFFVDKNTSSFLRNLQSEIGNSTNYISTVLVLFREVSVVIFLLILLISKSTSTMIIILLIFLLLTLIIYIFFKNTISTISQKSLELRERILKIVGEFVSSIKDIKIFKAEQYVLNNFTKIQKGLAENDFYLKNLYAFPRLLLEVVTIGTMLLFVIFFTSTSLSTSPDETLTKLTLLIFLLVRFMPAFRLINESLVRLRSLKVSIELIKAELNFNLSGKFKEKKKELITISEFENSINFKNVSFQYPKTDKLILDNISFKIQEGDFIGIIGQSGSGKTTLINLLSGLLTPTKGNIFIDRKNIKHYSISDIIGYVPQDIFLLDDTIKKNIAFGTANDNINEKNVLEATRISNLQKFLDTNSLGIEASVGNLGAKLSGGQKQRIGIARALYKNVPILILDESTSSLDTNIENSFIGEIKNIKKRLTIIFVSHRMTALKYCNKIYELKDRKIIESKDA